MALGEEETGAFRARLEAELAELRALDAGAAGDRRPVELDQVAVGRLSRMDAMQRQAMAQATGLRRAGRMAGIRAALARIEDGTFGDCAECGEEIAPKRLAIDPTVPTCIACAAGRG